MAAAKRKRVRVVRVLVQKVTEQMTIEAPRWAAFSAQPFPEPEFYMVQPVIVYDDGETLEEVPHPAVRVTAEEWPTYSRVKFPAEIRKWQRELDAEQGNRTQRRAKPKPKKK